MIIGLAGKKRAGKTTVANYLTKEGWTEMSWAEPLKEIVGRGLFGLTDSQLYGDTTSKEEVIPLWGMSSRQILQVVGTDLFRKGFDPDIWVKIGILNLGDFLKSNPQSDIVVSDCRFPNELLAIQEFAILHQIPYSFTWVQRPAFKMTDTHESENSLDSFNFDYVLTAGEGEFEVLYKQVNEVVDALRKGR